MLTWFVVVFAEHLQAKAKESQVDQSGFLILLGSSLLFVAVIIGCGFFCCKSPQVALGQLRLSHLRCVAHP